MCAIYLRCNEVVPSLPKQFEISVGLLGHGMLYKIKTIFTIIKISVFVYLRLMGLACGATLAVIRAQIRKLDSLLLPLRTVFFIIDRVL